jgi:Chromosome segregation ATPases
MFYKLYEEKELLEKEQKNLQSELGGLKLEHERLLEEIGSLSNDITRIQTKIESINEALKEKEYDGTIYEEQKKSASKLKEELERTKKLLESMSDINLKAEEEYEETLNRLKDYKEKLDQLIKDKQAIKAMIEEIDRKKYSAFMEAFNNIRKNFKEIYAKVSYQGKADLSLDNEEDPFSGGVSIFVKPRGKDVQYVEAISGGEQTLAAMSLIFAIQEYKPSVFYYFDEIDAHLDEANAYLLGQMIKEKSKNVQFIVVTLRENLANFADKLIGVTNKDGISKTLTFKSLKEVS